MRYLTTYLNKMSQPHQKKTLQIDINKTHSNRQSDTNLDDYQLKGLRLVWGTFFAILTPK